MSEGAPAKYKLGQFLDRPNVRSAVKGAMAASFRLGVDPAEIPTIIATETIVYVALLPLPPQAKAAIEIVQFAGVIFYAIGNNNHS